MKLLIRALMVFALAASVHVAHAQLRPEVGKPLQQASELLKAGRAKEALAKVREADAVANKTPAEQLTVDRMRGAAAARAGEPQTAIKSFEATMASGKLSPAEQAQTAEQLAHLYSQVKDWNKTREWAQKAKQLGGNAADLDKLLAYVNSQSGDFAAIARDAQAAIEAAEKAGRRPEEADLLRLSDALRRTGNNAGQSAVLEKLVSNYPKQEYWAIVLGRIQSKPGFSGRLTFDVMRLRRETKTLETAEDYVEMTQLALQNGQAAEAKAVIDEGFARGIVGKGAEAERQKRLQALAAQKAADAPRDLAKAEAEAAGRCQCPGAYRHGVYRPRTVRQGHRADAEGHCQGRTQTRRRCPLAPGHRQPESRPQGQGQRGIPECEGVGRRGRSGTPLDARLTQSISR